MQFLHHIPNLIVWALYEVTAELKHQLCESFPNLIVTELGNVSSTLVAQAQPSHMFVLLAGTVLCVCFLQCAS